MQEAECSGSNKFDVSSSENREPDQNENTLGAEHITTEFERCDYDVGSPCRRNDENHEEASHHNEDAEEAFNRTEGTNDVDESKVADQEEREVYDTVGISDSAAAEVVPEKGAEETLYIPTISNEQIVLPGSEDKKGGSAYLVNDISVSPRAVHKDEDCMAFMGTPNEEINVTQVDNETGVLSVHAETNQQMEGTRETDGLFSSSEACKRVVVIDSDTEDHLGQHSESNPVKLPHHVTSNEFSAKPRVQEELDQDMKVDDVDEQKHLHEETLITDHKRSETTLGENSKALSEGQTTSCLTNKGSFDLNQLAEVVRGLTEEEVEFLIRSRASSYEAKSGDVDALETLKQQIYVANVAKDLFSLQLAEQVDLHLEFDKRERQLLNEVSKVCSLLEETQDCNRSLDKELTQCRSELQGMAAAREDFEKQLLCARKGIEELTTRASDLQNKLESSHEELTCMAGKLADCRDLLTATETDNANLNGRLLVVIDEKRKVDEEKEYFIQENKALSSQLLEYQEDLAVEHGKCAQLEGELGEAIVHIEQLIEENIFLSVSGDMHQAHVKEINGRHLQLVGQIEEGKNLAEDADLPGTTGKTLDYVECSQRSPDAVIGEVVPAVAKPLPHSFGEGLVEQLEREGIDDSAIFPMMAPFFEEAENIVQKLEKEIEAMHSHSISLSRSAGKVAGAGVSKLIQAFESKSHHEEGDKEETPFSEGQSAKDPYISAKEQIVILRTILKKLDLNAGKVNEMLREEQSRTKQATTSFSELEPLYEASKKQISHLEATCNELVGKFEEYSIRMDELNGQSSKMHQSSGDMVTLLQNQVDSLQKDVDQRTSSLEQDLNSAILLISESAQKLDSSISGFMGVTSPTAPFDDSDVGCRLTASVNAANGVMGELRNKLDTAHRSKEELLISYEFLRTTFFDLHVKNELAVSLLGMVYSNFVKFLTDSGEVVNGIEMDVRDNRLLNLLQPSHYFYFMEQLENLWEEKLQLQLAKNNLDSELGNKYQEIEELSRSCIDSKVIIDLVASVKAAVKLDDVEIDSSKPPILLLESLITFLVQQRREATFNASSSREELASKLMELNKLEEEMHQLSSLSSQQEAETNLLQENIKLLELDLEAARIELHAKGAELEQSEQRYSSVRDGEIELLKESVRKLELGLEAVQSELQAKGAELEQSEQRLSSVREKLSIAVAKGKGLIVQRDNLKLSLSEMSAELERCSHELQLKDAKLREVETKLKAYSEAGERIEALESELSYIRNSSTALREDFFIKDSVIQRIEEILEDLELPEHFHSRNIIEKISWLASSVSGNSQHLTDWDQKSSVEGGSYTDAGFVVTEGWNDEVQPSLTSGSDDFRRKYEELQAKFYGVAEQNEMLEQSLTERNNLVQRWEEILDRVDMPMQLRSMEPEERIRWLGSALNEAHSANGSLIDEVNRFESHCQSLADDLVASQRKISDLESALLAMTDEKELLLKNLESVVHENEELLQKAIQHDIEKVALQNEVSALQEELAQKLVCEGNNHVIEADVERLQVLISDALQDQNIGHAVCDGSDFQYLEELLKKLIEKYKYLALERPGHEDIVREREIEESALLHTNLSKEDTMQPNEPELVALKEELEGALINLGQVQKERNEILEKHNSLVMEVQELLKLRDELQDKLTLEEQKLASTRDKLNMAVRKGKGLVQHRDSMKQTIDEMNSKMERLESELKQREWDVTQYELKVKDLLTYKEKVEVLERDVLSLTNSLAEREHSLWENEETLSKLIITLNAMSFDGGMDIENPVNKMEQLRKVYDDLKDTRSSSEHELKKTKRAMELLLAELNDVQERADGLQEELSKANATIGALVKERDHAEAARIEALSHVENFVAVQSEVRKKELMEASKLKSSIDQLRKGFVFCAHLVGGIFSTDLELLHNVETVMAHLLKKIDQNNAVNLPVLNAPGVTFPNNFANEVKPHADNLLDMKIEDHSIAELFGTLNNDLHECEKEIIALNEKCYKHSDSSAQLANGVSKVLEAFHTHVASQYEYLESVKREATNLTLMRNEKDSEILAARRNMALLYDSCSSSISEIENLKARLIGNGFASEGHKLGNSVKLSEDSDCRKIFDGETSITEEVIKNIADNLLSAMKELVSIQAELVDQGQSHLKANIQDLQKELQEKDVQKNRICTELVSQIKEAESIAKAHLLDLESAKAQVGNLEKQKEHMKNERNVLELRIKELQEGEVSAAELQERIASLKDLLAAKEQEIEALMQALDEEESQMEGLTNRIEELENNVQQKNLALENLEASRGKAIAKLSTTVMKFDELHQLSESLLSEIENLQSQLQERDAEISFLRQEVTRCTNDALVASQEGKKMSLTAMEDLLMWLGTMISRIAGYDVHLDDKEYSRLQAYKDIFEEKIVSIMSELADLRVMAQNKDALLQAEKSRIEELLLKGETLENSLREKDMQLASFQGVRDPAESTSISSAEILEVEPMISKRAVTGASIAPQIRGVRKLNSDQIAIDMDPDGSTLDDEEDDKVHGFKSLTTSRVVPKFTRPVSDMVDGLWVSCDRALMRQPALRLSIIFYWVVMHILLATSIV
ncbi:hypothetical protein Scep_023206 [Stephania cephalantha]|uniref:Uncharacterized protein n=1 Tax=Stephania cephalantha TaxID=152367 RepID=A0AAP0EV49_9MAGN